MDAQESPEEGIASNTVGETLRHAREAKGMSRADVSAATRVAERHLLAIEENRLNDLAARTYAVGFSRAYARAVGLDEADIAEQVRRQLAADEGDRPPPTLPSFEPGDPARVPPWGLAALAGIGFIAVVGGLFLLWGNLFSPEGELPDLLSEKPPVAAAAPAKKAVAAPVGVPGGPVVLTATVPSLWLKVYLPDGTQLLQKELAQGESYTVPADARGALLRTGRPDVLAISVGGRALPRLSDKPVIMGDVSLAPADLVARTTSAPAPAAIPPSIQPPSVQPSATQAPAPQRQASPPPARATSRPTLQPSPAPAQSTPPAPAPAPAASPSPEGSVSTELP